MKLTDKFYYPPPIMLPMQREVQAGRQGQYDSQGRYCAPPTEISFSALEQNITALNAHQQTQWTEGAEFRLRLDEKFEEMERRIKDATALMHYTTLFHPNIIKEFNAVRKTKQRIGVSNDPSQ